jgi:hypothetical protein
VRFAPGLTCATLEFQYEDFYAGIRAGNQVFHLKRAGEKDPSIEFVVRLVKDVHETPWGTREFVIKDDQGHTLYFGEEVRP